MKNEDRQSARRIASWRKSASSAWPLRDRLPRPRLSSNQSTQANSSGHQTVGQHSCRTTWQHILADLSSFKSAVSTQKPAEDLTNPPVRLREQGDAVDILTNGQICDLEHSDGCEAHDLEARKYDQADLLHGGLR